MSFRPTLPRLLVALLLSGALLTLPGARAANNILLIIADDLGADSFPLTAVAGASLPPMPNVSALKNAGVLFRNAHAHPTCSPTRAAILTGRHPFRTGIGQALQGATSPQLQVSEFTLPDAFAANPALGYTVASFGKWHLTAGAGTAATPNTIGGWPHYAGGLPGALTDYFNWTKTTDGVSATVTTYATTDTTNDVVAWIQAHNAAPWFAWVAFNAPHTPFHKPPNDLHSYDALPTTVGLDKRPYFEAACEAMDTEIARILAVVDLTRTTVIFVGDNGTPPQVIQAPYSSAHAKDSLYEGGTRVPLIIAGAGVVNPNRDNTAAVGLVDLYATILELAGINAAATQPAANLVDAKSLLPLLQNTADSGRFAFSQQFGGTLTPATSGQTLRDGPGFKLLEFADGHEEFYDLNADPDEQNNLPVATLNATQLASYHGLKLEMTKYQDTLIAPVVQSVDVTGSQATVRVVKSAGVTNYTLYRSAGLTTYGTWLPVNGATLVDEGTTVRLVDPNASGAEFFYRVLAQ